MKTKVEVDVEVLEFTASLAPAPRHQLRLGIRGLERGVGDLAALEGTLEGYWRLRVGDYRVLLRYFMRNGQQICRCVFAERRATVYEIFEALLIERLQLEDRSAPEDR